MAWVAAAAVVVGTALQYSAQRKAAKAERSAADSRQHSADVEAAHMDQQATLSVAAAQRQMLEERKQARLLESRALAVAAASGAGASDNTVVNIISNIAAEGAHRSAIALYEGKERARQLQVGAQIRREGGDLQAEYGRQAAKAHEIGSIGTLFSGAGSLYARYGQPAKTTTGSDSGLSGGLGLE
jgi:hypothetical protein